MSNFKKKQFKLNLLLTFFIQILSYSYRHLNSNQTREEKGAEAMNTIESRSIRIKLVDGTQINGEVNLNRGTGYDRLSDLVGDYQENFLTIFNATLYEKNLDPQLKWGVS